MATQPSAKVHCTWIEVRGASGSDPGEIALIYYVADGPKVSLTDALGQPLKESDGRTLGGQVRPGENCVALAKRLARRAGWSNRVRSGIPLFYADAVVV